jgi:hypothetical protein
MSSRLRPHPIRRVGAALAAVTVVVALALAAIVGPGAAPAGAHDGDAVVTLEATHPAGLSIHYIVRVTWANDGHPVTDGNITGTAVGADGTQLTPVPFTPIDQDGRYEGVVSYPAAGAWTVRITSVEPTGKLEQAEDVTAPAPTEPQEVTPEVTTGEEGGFAPGDDGTGDSGELGEEATTAADAGDEGDAGGSDSGMSTALIVGAAVVALVGAATAVNMIRRRRGVPPGDDGAGPAGDGNGSDSGDAAAAAPATRSTSGAGSAGDPTAAGR